MNTGTELTIVIPAKNEAKLIPRLLTSLTKQDYSKMSSTKVLVADAHSTDGTPDIVLSFRGRLKVRVIRGGMPSVGRNHGAALADTPYVLFLDADIELAHPSDRKSTRLNSSHTDISTLPLHDALPILFVAECHPSAAITVQPSPILLMCSFWMPISNWHIL